MSNFSDHHELFMKPKTEQYGTHMVMTNVQQQNKIKYISIDSKYKDDYQDNNKALELYNEIMQSSLITSSVKKRVKKIHEFQLYK